MSEGRAILPSATHQNQTHMKINYQHKALEYHENYPDGGLFVEGKYEVCTTCDGHGHHFRSDLDENHMVDMMREDCDYEGIEDYYGGSFDQICSQCKGQRVVFSPILPKWAEDRIWDWHESERESRACRDAERRMGA
jgi:DnaJ-class molecular chaperone